MVENLIFGEPHENAEKRFTVSAVIQRKSDKKFLLVKWLKFGWVAPSVGGIDEGETCEAAAERELLEETGYKVKSIRKLGGLVESHFFAENKNVWRHRIDQPILLELLDETPLPVLEEEKSRQVVEWLDFKEAIKQMSHPDNTVGIRRHLGLSEEIEDVINKKY